MAFIGQPVSQVPDGQEQTAGGQQRGWVLLVAGGPRAHRLVAVEHDLVQVLADVVGRDRQVEGVVTPRGAIEVDRPGLLPSRWSPAPLRVGRPSADGRDRTDGTTGTRLLTRRSLMIIAPLACH